MKTLKIFEHKGAVGATTNTENGKFMNDPSAKSQIGVVVSVEDAVISPTALAIMKNNYYHEGGSFAQVMLSKSTEDHKSSIGLLGFDTHIITDDDGRVGYGRTCDISVLDEIEVSDDIEVPQDFKDHIDAKYPPAVVEAPMHDGKMYKAKDMEVEVVQFTGENRQEVHDFLDGHSGPDGESFLMGDTIYLETDAGQLTGAKGDYIVKTDKNCYLYPKDCFEAFFVEVGE